MNQNKNIPQSSDDKKGNLSGKVIAGVGVLVAAAGLSVAPKLIESAGAQPTTPTTEKSATNPEDPQAWIQDLQAQLDATVGHPDKRVHLQILNGFVGNSSEGQYGVAHPVVEPGIDKHVTTVEEGIQRYSGGPLAYLGSPTAEHPYGTVKIVDEVADAPFYPDAGTSNLVTDTDVQLVAQPDSSNFRIQSTEGAPEAIVGPLEVTPE